jgi:hypothetical protein
MARLSGADPPSGYRRVSAWLVKVGFVLTRDHDPLVGDLPARLDAIQEQPVRSLATRHLRRFGDAAAPLVDRAEARTVYLVTQEATMA